MLLVSGTLGLHPFAMCLPQKGELAYLGGWAAILAAIGLRLPQQQLEALCSYVGRHKQQLNRGDRKELMRAFEAWGHQPGLALLGSNT